LTAADVLLECDVAGIDVALREDGQPVVRAGRPNAALMAALKEHRAGIIELLGGKPVQPGPVRCDGYVYRRKVDGTWREKPVACGAWVYEAIDHEFFCSAAKWCPFRLQARGEGS
jgi:hypothetical protein